MLDEPCDQLSLLISEPTANNFYVGISHIRVNVTCRRAHEKRRLGKRACLGGRLPILTSKAQISTNSNDKVYRKLHKHSGD